MESKKCPCCPNHCDKESLSCGRGEEYFHGTKKLVKKNQVLSKKQLF